MNRPYFSAASLARACSSPAALEAIAAGGALPDGVLPEPAHEETAGAGRFIELAGRFVDWLRDPAVLAETGGLRHEFAIWRALGARFADAAIDRLLAAGKPAEAADLAHALEQFSLHLAWLRQERGDWPQIFFDEERDPVAVELGGVLVAGGADCLRKRLDGTIEVVVYAPASGDPRETDRCRLALCVTIFRQRHPGLPCVAVVESFQPRLAVAEIAEPDLAAIFRQKVEPVLARLARRRSGSRPAAPPPAAAAEGSVLLGYERAAPGRPVLIGRESLASHGAVLAGDGDVPALALSVVEQLLLRGVPAILVDRRGDLCRYADPATRTPDSAAAETLFDRMHVDLFTPGHEAGRDLTLPLFPPGTGLLPVVERALVLKGIAAGLGGLLRYSDSPANRQKSAVLFAAVDVCAAAGNGNAGLEELIRVLTEHRESLQRILGAVDRKVAAKVAQDLQTLLIMNRGFFSPDTERLDLGRMLARRDDGRVPLTIVSTRFLGDTGALLFWVTRFLIEVLGYCGRHPSPRLQGVIFLDEADLYLPATSRPPTKEPLESLLRRGRSAGLGVLIGTQSPGDLDYHCRENITTWALGRITQDRALEKLKPIFGRAGIGRIEDLASQRVGEFVVVGDETRTAIKAVPPLVKTEQLPETRILELARRTAEPRP